MDELQGMVGGRAAVPKEQVYPRFDSLAKLWAAFRDELALLQAREITLETLRACLTAGQTVPTLDTLL